MNARYERVSVQQFYSRWQADRECCVVDVRSAAEYGQGHVPGARLVPLDRIHATYAALPKQQNIYLICHSGMRSQMAAGILAGQGFAHLINVEGGTAAWKQAGYPVQS